MDFDRSMKKNHQEKKGLCNTFTCAYAFKANKQRGVNFQKAVMVVVFF